MNKALEIVLMDLLGTRGAMEWGNVEATTKDKPHPKVPPSCPIVGTRRVREYNFKCFFQCKMPLVLLTKRPHVHMRLSSVIVLQNATSVYL